MYGRRENEGKNEREREKKRRKEKKRKKKEKGKKREKRKKEEEGKRIRKLIHAIRRATRNFLERGARGKIPRAAGSC